MPARKKTSARSSPTEPSKARPAAASEEAQLEGFFTAYEPAVAKFGRALRAKLRARLPGLNEIVYVYENQGALVISYSPSEHGHEGLCGMALYPTETRVFFGRGAELAKADPGKLLHGSGKTVRYVVLASIADFGRPELEALMSAALKLAKLRLDARAQGAVIVRAASQQQRARRTSNASRRR